MKFTIIGWYGTETIGDRAILSGLISLFSKAYGDFEIYLGSLYPFFSERTVNEDYAFWKKITGKEINLEIFNSKNSKELDSNIIKSDAVVMGGGPLMDLDELFMVEYAFKKAKQMSLKTALLGCGVGPLFYNKYKKAVLEIAINSDIIILRDRKAKDNLLEIGNEFHKNINKKNVFTSFDPAVECAMTYNSFNIRAQEGYIAVNMRDFPSVYYCKGRKRKDINAELKKFIIALGDKFSNHMIKLIPMHYFHIGNDDRLFLNSIALELQRDNIEVQNRNLSLEETIKIYQNACFNIGMRFHSVVLQTIVSGKNYILDYTEPKRGKIYGFLQDIDRDGFYKQRYICLQENNITADIVDNVEGEFCFDKATVQNKLNIYVDKLREITA